MQMDGPRQKPWTLSWAKCQILLDTLFICNDIDKNLNKNFYSSLSYRSFKLLFLFFQVCAISNSKKFEMEKWPKAGYLPLYTQDICNCHVDHDYQVTFFR